jgi:polygalacturonase
MSQQPVSRREFVGIGAGLATAAMAKQADTTRNLLTPALYNVRTFGAKGDGKTIDTPAINKAIETAAASGGGTVYFPAGTYLCFSLRLKNKITLYLDQGTIVQAEESGAAGQYDPAEPNPWDKFQDYGHSHWHNSLLWGEGIENISILGPGLIWGKGLSRGTRDQPQAENPGVGNKAISLKNCRNVVLRDFSILHGGHFGILAIAVDNFTVDNLTIDTNRDGIDIDCCRNVRVSNCSVNSPWDDGICLKSSFGLGYARATEMVTITNCTVSGFLEGSLLDATYKRTPPRENVSPTGRIKFGTESNGGFKNVTISNCVFDYCRGLALETVDGGLLEDVTITNLTMRDITNSPIFLRLGSRMRGPEGAPIGALRRVTISNIVCSNSAPGLGSIISGIPGNEVEDIRLSDIYIQHQGGGKKEDAQVQAPENENKYPEPTMFGKVMPNHGFFIRHAKNIQLSNIEIAYAQEDLRPAFVLQNVTGADFFRIRAQHAREVPIFALKNVAGFSLAQSRPLADVLIENIEEKML